MISESVANNFKDWGPVYMRRAGPLASWLANNAARVYMRDLIVSYPWASPANSSHVPSFFCVRFKERGNVFWLFQFYKRKNVCRPGPWRQMWYCARVTGRLAHFSSLNVKSQPIWGGIPTVNHRDLSKAGHPSMRINADWSCGQKSAISPEGEEGRQRASLPHINRLLYSGNFKPSLFGPI